MNILILGSGGREHAFATQIVKSAKCEKLFVAPGNGGTASIATNIELSVTDFSAIAQLVIKEDISLVVVGPEVPLVLGIVDFFKADPKLSHIKIIGPDKKGAALEGSKEVSKNFMNTYGIPTAFSKTITKNNLEEGLGYLEKMTSPYVLKADGLAAGKGVIITSDLKEAKEALTEMIANSKFGAASEKVLLEEFLTGIELSVFVVSDGKNYVILPEAKDYKRIGEGDQGLNTGGMGAVSPVPFATADFMKKVEELVVKPTLNGFQKENIDYKGFVFIGLMNNNGNPSVIEYNVRMGDPETQVVLPRIKSDFLELLIATADQKLDEYKLDVFDNYAVTTVLVAGGYPESYEKGNKIEKIEPTENVTVFHAGTKIKNTEILSNGGRVMAITATGNTIVKSIEDSQKKADEITFKDKYFRKDIGKDLLPYIKN